MQEYVHHCYNLTDKAVLLINVYSGNKQIFPKRQINSADQAKYLYTKLGYPSVKYFRENFQSEHIIDYPVTVQYINFAHAIQGKNIAALKGDTTGKKPIHVAGDIVKFSEKLIKLTKML